MKRAFSVDKSDHESRKKYRRKDVGSCQRDNMHLPKSSTGIQNAPFFQGPCSSKTKEKSMSSEQFSKRNWSRENNDSGRRKNYTANKHDEKTYTNIFSLKSLENLIKKNSSDIVFELVNSYSSFENFLNNKIESSKLCLLVKVLSKVSLTDFHEYKSDVLVRICRSKFLEQLVNYFISLPYKGCDCDFTEFVSSLMLFFKNILNLMPHLNIDIDFTKIFHAFDTAINGMQEKQNVSISSDLKVQFNHLKVQLESMNKGKRNRQTLKMSPISFRDISIYPLPQDILSEDLPCLRRNVTGGAYEDVEHYLDTQFHLLREDFVSPLREGINEYLTSINNKTNRKKVISLRFYKNVNFYSPRVTSGRIGMVVNFDPDQRMRRYEWKNSKRFKFGSLLCFTKDDFKTLFLATVVESDLDLLTKGLIVVQLCAGTAICDSLFTDYYTMAESDVFFEPYFHVLKGLQALSNESFPMKRYIIDVDCSSEFPKYLSFNVLYKVPKSQTKSSYTAVSASNKSVIASSGSCTSSSQPLVKKFSHGQQEMMEYTLNIFNEKSKMSEMENHMTNDEHCKNSKVETVYRFCVLDLHSWPSKEQLGLDLSQYKSFQAALTREFVVIQGPPGTGKTFLGLKVAEYLLENASVWNKRKCPILVVGFTNHALDQFLEGLLPITQQIVRVGGQSKNESLKPFNLNALRSKKFNYKFNKKITAERKKIRNEMEAVLSCFKKIELDLETLYQKTGIVSLQSLKDIVDTKHLHCFMSDMDVPCDKKFEYWLFEDVSNIKSMGETMQYEYGDGVSDLEGLGKKTNNKDQKNIENEHDHHVDDLNIQLGNVGSRLKMIVTVKMLENEIGCLKRSVSHKQKESCSDLKIKQKTCEQKLVHLKSRLSRTCNPNKQIIKKIKGINDLWKTNIEERWILYSFWLNELKNKLFRELGTVYETFIAAANKFEKMRQIEDLNILQEALVVGITTTGAARLQSLVRALKPPIVIIEEAAEILEPHTVTAITNECQHVILIGDHQQLKPATGSYTLAQSYKYDMSLFERMVRNGMHCEVLKVQHRMRPEFLKLIVPQIYPELYNHPSVLNFPPVQGISSSLFFLTHNFPDEKVPETSSYRNVHEADFLIALCKYLLLQGYDPSEITILTTYTGQMLYLTEQQQKSGLARGVQITVVDNFQGKENNIILLSLVRSNIESNIGFLKTDNRVCVALSRARHGMYISGNIDDLAQESDLWKKIEKSLIKQKALGSRLTLCCKIHSDQKTNVASAKDFEKVPCGGCSLICGEVLKCGHTCKQTCHINNRDHAFYKCTENCTKTCEFGHPCTRKCYEICGQCENVIQRILPCSHVKELKCYIPYKLYTCKERVMKKLPACEHEVMAQCNKKVEDIICPILCKSRLHCGHICPLICHIFVDPDHLNYKCKQQCTRNNAKCSTNHKCKRLCYEKCGTCRDLIEVELPKCGHIETLECSMNPELFNCKKTCKRKLPCGHLCRKRCGETCNDCNVMVKTKIPGCGHKVELVCGTTPKQAHCSERKCDRLLKCGHHCREPCRKKCTQKCIIMVDNNLIESPCGHTVKKIPCYFRKGGFLHRDEIINYCNAPCSAELDCGHKCSGSCGKCNQGRIHVRCRATCGKILVCGHRCDSLCSIPCPPCLRKCEYRCKHSHCRKPCGSPCDPCKEPCTWRCRHYKCKRLCSEICDHPPCLKQCLKVLKCGHKCIGYCGDQCPDLCKICNEEEIKQMSQMLGHGVDDDTRFVMLEDCGHTIEAITLEKWFDCNNTKDIEIANKMCPLCRTAVKTTKRYMNIIKEFHIDIQKIKCRLLRESDLEQRRKDLSQKLKSVAADFPGNFPVVFLHFYESVREKLLPQIPKGRLHTLNSNFLEMIEMKISLLTALATKMRTLEFFLSPEASNKIFKQIEFILKTLNMRNMMLSSQEVTDFNLELLRLQRITELCIIESTVGFINEMFLNDRHFKITHKRTTELAFDYCQRYSGEIDETFKNNLKKLKEFLILSIEETELKQIINKEVGYEQGHWFKCPKDHIYPSIVKVQDCPQCEEKDVHRRLLQFNFSEKEMDVVKHDLDEHYWLNLY